MDNKPALNLFESIEPNGTVELEGLGTVNLSHFPYRKDLAYGWPDDAVRFHDQALPFDGRKLLYGHTHQLSAAGARPESLNVNSARTAGLRQVDMGAELGVRPRRHVTALRDLARRDSPAISLERRSSKDVGTHARSTPAGSLSTRTKPWCRGGEKFFAVDETESTKYDTVVAHGDTSPGSFPVRVERKENGIDLTNERQAFKERDIGSRSARS